MKLLMVIAPRSRAEALRAAISQHDVHSYSEIDDITGEGVTGKHFGTHVWPGSSRLTFTVIPDDKADKLFAAVESFKRELYPDEGIKAFLLPVERSL